MSEPVVTLVLPIYNTERYLRESIGSILAQTFTDFEVIAVLDACTDRSEEILNEMKDGRFTVLKKEKNEGVGAASDLALQRARGEFMARMDSDDIMESTRISRQVEFLRMHPEVDVVGTWFDYLDEQGKFLRQAFPFPTVHEEIKNEFRVRVSVGGATAMYRTAKLRAAGGFSSELTSAEDLQVMLKCLAAGCVFANIPEVLYHYRQHRVQLTRSEQQKMWRITNEIYRAYGSQIWGEDAPDFELGAPLHRRVLRKLKKLIS